MKSNWSLNPDCGARQNRPGVRGCAAFTLLELLVAFAVLGLLSALVFGGTQKMRYSAREALSVSNIRQLAAANLAYAADHGRFVPDSDGDLNGFKVRWFGSRSNANMKQPYGGTGGYLSDYLAGGVVRYCPVLQAMFDEDPSLVGSGYFEKESGGYGYNSAYIGKTPHEILAPGGAGSDVVRPTRPQAGVVADSKWPGNFVANMRDTSRTVMFTSTAMAGSGGGLVETAETVPYVDYAYESSMTPTTHFRFRGLALVAWVDGHVSFEKPNNASTSWNVYGGRNSAYQIGWFGPTDNNGYWNPNWDEGVLY